MADPAFDQISASTLADLRDDVVWDNFFVDGAVQRTLRQSGALDDYLGGTVMQEPFMYDRVIGGAIAPGSDVNIIQKQILAATAFVPKEYVEQVPLNLWQTNVINAGPAGKVKLVDLYMTNAVMAESTDINIDFYQHGQASTTTNGITTNNRQIFLNGVTEALNDGSNPSWDGNVFGNYGGQSRNGAVTNTLNSIPYWGGTQAGGTSQVTFKALLEGYLNCVQAPDTGICNKALFAYILEREEVKQRFAQETDPRIGMTGIKVMDAYIHVDKLAPSTKYGSILPSGLSLTTSIKPSAFTTPSSVSNSSISNFPTSTSVTPGEPFFWFRLKGWKIRPSVDPEYNHNFTPPIRSQNNPDLIVMFYKCALNTYTPAPRDNWQSFGWGF